MLNSLCKPAEDNKDLNLRVTFFVSSNQRMCHECLSCVKNPCKKIVLKDRCKNENFATV